ncbi:MAG: DUF4249 family protein [Chryseolinea sp.]
MRYLFFIILGFACVSCETTIHPELEQPEKIIVVDAWVNQKMERQRIAVTRSQSYFDNNIPQKISNAEVNVYDVTSGEVYHFEEGDHAYYWEPQSTPFGTVGHIYHLTVDVDGEKFEAVSRLGRVPSIDSIEFAFNKKDLIVNQDYFTAEFNAVEPAGVGDTYWIKAWKNGHQLNKPGELNMTFDASFTPGQSVDGQQFIIPIRRDFISPLDENPEKKNEMLPPYVVGDSVYVEIHSIDPMAYEFLFGVYFQITRPGGFAELFSMPLANATTNILNVDKNSSTRAGGFFNVSAISGRGQKLTPELAAMARENAK